MHEISTPIVEGTDECLPGLQGLRTLEQQRAVLDIGNRRLIFPGPGDVKTVPPPGSIVVPLEKAPSGHLCMIIDAFDTVPKNSTVACLNPTAV